MNDQETAIALMCQARLGMQAARTHLELAESALGRDGSLEVAMANLISAGVAMAHCLGKFNSALAGSGAPNPASARASDYVEDSVTAS